MAFTFEPIRWPGEEEASTHDFRMLSRGKAIGRIHRRNVTTRGHRFCGNPRVHSRNSLKNSF